MGLKWHRVDNPDHLAVDRWHPREPIDEASLIFSDSITWSAFPAGLGHLRDPAVARGGLERLAFAPAHAST